MFSINQGQTLQLFVTKHWNCNYSVYFNQDIFLSYPFHKKNTHTLLRASALKKVKESWHITFLYSLNQHVCSCAERERESFTTYRSIQLSSSTHSHKESTTDTQQGHHTSLYRRNLQQTFTKQNKNMDWNKKPKCFALRHVITLVFVTREMNKSWFRLQKVSTHKILSSNIGLLFICSYYYYDIKQEKFFFFSGVWHSAPICKSDFILCLWQIWK